MKCLAGLSTVVIVSCAHFIAAPVSNEDPVRQVDLSPAGWAEGELEKYFELNKEFKKPKPLVSGTRGMVASTNSAPAVRAGLEALKQGGSSVDAVMTTALAQVALAGGSTVSYAGVLTMVHYDASTGTIHTMDAGYNTVLEEDDPLTIPRANFADPTRQSEPGPRGRTVLVPGFMAGVEAAHKRFGKLPFEALFGPAVFFAEQGFEFNSKLNRYLGYRKEILSRLPETKSVFTKTDGVWLELGDSFEQKALAETLRTVAERGARFMYKGAWAEKFVEAVQNDGGKMTMEDLASYSVAWREALHITYHEHDIHSYPGTNSLAGVLNLMEAADWAAMGHYSQSPESFFWFTQIIRAVMMNPIPTFERTDDWSKKETAATVWKKMQEGSYPSATALKEKTPGHSHAVVAVDEAGNITALLHSINTVVWGESGIFVDGVSIPDSATFQQGLIDSAGPGKRLENQTAPLIVMKEGRPVMALSCIGSGILHETPKVLLNALDFHMNAMEALEAPSLLIPDFGSRGLSASERIVEGSFSNPLIEGVRALGLKLEEIPKLRASLGRGYAVCITIDPEKGSLEGAAPAFSNGAALSY